jgi:hypothetical protein
MGDWVKICPSEIRSKLKDAEAETMYRKSGFQKFANSLLVGYVSDCWCRVSLPKANSCCGLNPRF